MSSNDEYKHLVSNKVQKFMQNLSWQIYFFLNPKETRNKEKRDMLGYPSSKCAPRVQELAELEDKMIDLVIDLIFKSRKHSGNNFPRKLHKDLRDIRAEYGVYLGTDNSLNK